MYEERMRIRKLILDKEPKGYALTHSWKGTHARVSIWDERGAQVDTIVGESVIQAYRDMAHSRAISLEPDLISREAVRKWLTRKGFNKLAKEVDTL